MPEPIALPEQTAQQVERLGPLDFVVGITSGNHAETIGGVVQAAWTGLERSFPGARVAIVHADSGSRDGTVERAAAAMPGERLVQGSTSAAPPPPPAPALPALFPVGQGPG